MGLVQYHEIVCECGREAHVFTTEKYKDFKCTKCGVEKWLQ